MGDGIRLFDDGLKKGDFVYCLASPEYLGRVKRYFKNGKADIDWGQWSKRMSRDKLCLVLPGKFKGNFMAAFEYAKKNGLAIKTPPEFLAKKLKEEGRG